MRNRARRSILSRGWFPWGILLAPGLVVILVTIFYPDSWRWARVIHEFGPNLGTMFIGALLTIYVLDARAIARAKDERAPLEIQLCETIWLEANEWLWAYRSEMSEDERARVQPSERIHDEPWGKPPQWPSDDWKAWAKAELQNKQFLLGPRLRRTLDSINRAASAPSMANLDPSFQKEVYEALQGLEEMMSTYGSRWKNPAWALYGLKISVYNLTNLRRSALQQLHERGLTTKPAPVEKMDFIERMQLARSLYEQFHRDACGDADFEPPSVDTKDYVEHLGDAIRAAEGLLGQEEGQTRQSPKRTSFLYLAGWHYR